MQTLVNRTARELAREYFNGRLSFNDYRNTRRRLIDQVTGLDADVETDAQAETDSSTVIEETVPVSSVSDSMPAQETEREASRRFPMPVILLLVIGGVSAAGWILFSGEGDAPPEPVASNTQTPLPEEQAPAATGQALQLVSDFVRADNWSNDALAGFVIAWSALDVDDQDYVRSESGFRLLVDGLREQILEQRALGDNADDGREAVLMSFAEHLGALPLLADLQQAVIDTGVDNEPVTLPRKMDTRVPKEVLPPVAIEPAPEIVKPVEEAIAPQPPEKAPPPEVATLTVAKPAAKPVPESVPEPVPVPVQVKSAPIISAPARATKPVAGKDPCPASLVGTRRPVCRDTLTDGEPGPVLVVLQAGGFQMGSSQYDNEQPVHRVEIRQPFAISAYEVSRADYQRFCHASGANCPAGHWSGEYDPMTNVSWNDANAYVQWLSQVSGATYRLPSEAEWEYAARAGTTTDYPFGEGDRILPTDAHFDADSPLPVNDKSVNANRFRLRHIIGNVREWVADVWLENYQGAPGDGGARMQPDTGKRAVRGGSYTDDVSQLRSAARIGLPVNTRDRITGFRVVREIRN